MASKIPLEIINLIYSYRERHPIMNIICCWNCGENDWCYSNLYIYHRFIKKFEIICSDCNHDMRKK